MATHGGLNKQLYDAVDRNDIVTATALLERGTNINSRGGVLNGTALVNASDKGYKALVELLLSKGADINETDCYGTTALMLAARARHEEIVHLLLQKNADVDKQNVNGRAAIHWAAINNHLSVMIRLIGCGAAVDIGDSQDKTPLWFAASNGDVKCVDLLLCVGANPYRINKCRFGAPSMVAFKNDHTRAWLSLEDAATIKRGGLTKLLLDAVERNDIVAATAFLEIGVDINSRGAPRERTALIHASDKGCKESVQFLLSRGAAINETDSFKTTALMLAAGGGHEAIVHLLLQNNADKDKQNSSGWAAMHWAAANNQTFSLIRLVSCGATVDITQLEGRTPLWFAASKGYVNCVDLLLSVGANARRSKYRDDSPYDVARSNGHVEVVRRLDGMASGRGGLTKLLYDAVGRNDIVVAAALLESGVDVDSRGGHLNGTALTNAAEKGNKESAELLLSRGADISGTDFYENTALMLAARRGHGEIVDLLIRKNADIHKKNKIGRTAMHWAAIGNRPSIINRLLNCGAAVDIDDWEGQTPLWFAARNGHVNCVDLLLSVGAKPRHNDRRLPLDAAKEKGDSEVVKRIDDAMKYPVRSLQIQIKGFMLRRYNRGQMLSFPLPSRLKQWLIEELH